MRRYQVIILVCLIILILFSCGCSVRKDKMDFINTARKCVLNDESLLLQLFDQLNTHDIYSIELYKDEDKKEDTQDNVVYFNNHGFLVISKDEEAVSANIMDSNIFKVADDLISRYPKIYKIYNYTSLGYMQICFKEAYSTIDWSIVYYPPDIDSPIAGGDYEYYEEIQNGFYEYYFYPGL